MEEKNKNCPPNSYEKKLTPTQELSENITAESYYNKAKKCYELGFRVEIIEDYFMSIQFKANAILLKKINIRSKKSNCGYYKLYTEKIINEKIYQKIEEIREERNKLHYDGEISTLYTDEEFEKLLSNIEIVYKALEEVYSNA